MQLEYVHAVSVRLARKRSARVGSGVRGGEGPSVSSIAIQLDDGRKLRYQQGTGAARPSLAVVPCAPPAQLSGAPPLGGLHPKQHFQRSFRHTAPSQHLAAGKHAELEPSQR